jgi:hypothetical protein
LDGGQHSRNSLLEGCRGWLANVFPRVQVGGGARRNSSAMVVGACMGRKLSVI